MSRFNGIEFFGFTIPKCKQDQVKAIYINQKGEFLEPVYKTVKTELNRYSCMSIYMPNLGEYRSFTKRKVITCFISFENEENLEIKKSEKYGTTIRCYQGCEDGY
jgi:hypothetical protein